MNGTDERDEGSIFGSFLGCVDAIGSGTRNAAVVACVVALDGGEYKKEENKRNERSQSTILIPFITVSRSFSCQFTFVQLRGVFGQIRGGHSHVVDIEFFVGQR